MKQITALPKGTPLSKYVKERIETLSKSQKDVAQYIIDHLDEVAFQTAEELARRVETSSSTVVRFSQTLGFEGFPELQQAARDEYKRRSASTSANGSASDPALFSLEQTEFEAALSTDHVNVEDTAKKIDIESVEATSKAIVRAGRVIAIGFDQMAFFAGYLRYLLGLLDVQVEVITSPTQDALTRIARIDSRTLVIGMVAGRPDPLVIRSLKIARQRKGVAVAIADATMSEATKHCNLSFYYSSNSPSYVRSHTSLLSFIQALAYAVYAQDAAAFESRIRATKLK